MALLVGRTPPPPPPPPQPTLDADSIVAFMRRNGTTVNGLQTASAKAKLSYGLSGFAVEVSPERGFLGRGVLVYIPNLTSGDPLEFV